MKELEELIRYAQRRIGAADDGIIGQQTTDLVEKSINLIPGIRKDWTTKQKMVAIVQWVALSKNIEAGRVDGLFGTMTSYALEKLLYEEKNRLVQPTWRDEDKEQQTNLSIGRNLNPHSFPKYRDIEFYYGKAGKGKHTVEIPYEMRLAWDTDFTVKKITCHKNVSFSLTGILEDIRDFYGLAAIKELGLDLYGGAYNYRKMRGGKRLSTHAWGVAIDLDPARNRLRWNHTKAQFAKPEYSFLLDAFAAEGWVSLGEAKNYDWMHFQAVRI